MKSNILLGITGSIACYKSCELISMLVKAGHSVQVVATPSALQFVGAATLEGLSGRPVATDQFVNGQMMDHIALARWADIFVVAPMTASHLAQFANGLSIDLLTTLFLAFERSKPIYIAPAMNTKMLEHPATQLNIQTLRSWNIQVLETNSGRLACGEEGAGKMLEPAEILNFITKNTGPTISSATDSATSLPTRKRKILVTYGGTQEPIDGVRSITNFSTGRTGRDLIHQLSLLNYDVTALGGHMALEATHATRLLRFSSHQDLQKILSTELAIADYEVVIHLAAVSDFSVDKIITPQGDFDPDQNTKIGTSETLTLQLKKNAKIINNLRSYSRNKNIIVVAFKLTKTLNAEARAQAAISLLESSKSDLVVQYDLNEMNADQNRHPFTILSRKGEVKFAPTTTDLAKELHFYFQKIQNNYREEVNHDLMP